MIVPSIDIMGGRAVQLRRGRERVLDGGDPLERLEEFGVVGEIAVVDLDAAMGQGSNADLIRAMVRRHPCRVGGGIRSVDTALDWLDAGAAAVVIGTMATPEFLSRLPRERVIAAVDAEHGTVVVDAWRERTDALVTERIGVLAPYVAGFLLTQVEHEGVMQGFDWNLIEAAAKAAGSARVTAAGGITTADEVARLDAIGVEAQVGMALYTGRLVLGEAIAAPLVRPLPGDVWPTVVTEETGAVLGLVWSTRETVTAAVTARRGIYWSRSRGRPWSKGETSGNTQELVRVALDCDRDALRFVVRQQGTGFCHTGQRSCFGDDFDLGALERVIGSRARDGDGASGTARLLADADLLGAKLREEAGELSVAATPDEVTHEAADLLYFALVAMARAGVSLGDVQRELARRARGVRRRAMTAKETTATRAAAREHGP